MKLNGLVAVVTGGAQGIGRRITEELLIAGCKVVILDFDDIKATLFQNDAWRNNHGDDELRFINCDVRDQKALYDALEEAKKWKGRLDVLVNNAGIFTKDTHNNANMIKIKLVATIDATYKAIELMSKKKGGNGGDIINISALSGLRIGAEVSPAYTACESGVVAFTRALAFYPQEDGVRVNCVCPASVETKNARMIWDRRPSTEQFVKQEGKVDINEVVKAVVDAIEKQTHGQVYSVTPNDGINLVD